MTAKRKAHGKVRKILVSLLLALCLLTGALGQAAPAAYNVSDNMQWWAQDIKGYFSQMKSWEARTAYINDMKAQLKELVDTYDPAVLWFDGDWTYRKGDPTLSQWWTKKDGEDLYRYVKSLKDSIIVNERVCRGFGLGDFECPEQTIPEKAPSRPWETCQTMNGA